MKYKYNDEWIDVNIKALDSMPVGAIVEYDGQVSDIPNGWQAVSGGKIKKTSETTPTMASIVNTQNDSTEDAYSCDYINKLQPVVLYNNTNGTTGNVTLSETSANFSYIEIFYKSSDNNYNSTKVFDPNGKKVDLLSIHTDGTIYFKYKELSISGTSITNLSYGEAYFNSNTQSSNNTANNITIVRVIGYK